MLMQRHCKLKLKLSNKAKCALAAKMLLCCFVPVVFVLAGLMYYNAIRFGSPFDFGANYNLTSNDMTLRGHSIGRLLESWFYYLFATPSIESSFPYIKNLVYLPQLNTAIKTVSETFVGGIFFMTPFMLLALIELFNKRQRSFVKRFILLCFSFAFLIAAFDGEAASITYRYMCDFGFAVGFGSAVAILSISKSAQQNAAATNGNFSAAKGVKKSNAPANVKKYQAHKLVAALKTPSKYELLYATLIALSLVTTLLVWIGLDSSVVGLRLAPIQQAFDVLGPVIS